MTQRIAQYYDMCVPHMYFVQFNVSTFSQYKREKRDVLKNYKGLTYRSAYTHK